MNLYKNNVMNFRSLLSEDVQAGQIMFNLLFVFLNLFLITTPLQFIQLLILLHLCQYYCESQQLTFFLFPHHLITQQSGIRYLQLISFGYSMESLKQSLLYLYVFGEFIGVADLEENFEVLSSWICKGIPENVWTIIKEYAVLNLQLLQQIKLDNNSTMIQRYSLSFSFEHSSRVFKLKDHQQCREDASLSFIISAALFITEHLPLLKTPIQVNNQEAILKNFLQKLFQNKIYHPYIELWSDTILKRISERATLLHQDTVYIDIQQKQSDLQHFKHTQQFEEIEIDQNLKQIARIRKIFNLPQSEINNKKMAIFTTHPHLPQGYPFAPRIHMNALLLALYYNNEQWFIYDLSAGQLPSLQEITQLDGVVITGSRLTVLDTHPVMRQALQNLQLAMEANKKLRVFGVCFGHQLLAKYFNAKVERRVRKAGLEQIVLNEDIKDRFPFLSETLQKRNKFLQCEHHQDYVVQVPKGFLLFGESQSCPVESLLREDGRILTTQFHTEFLVEYFMKFIERARYFYNNNQLYQQFVKEQKPQTKDREEQSVKDSKIWVKCIRNFFRQTV